MRTPPADRFAAKVVNDPSGCWRWTGTILPNGYGHFRGHDSVMILAHRFAYTEFVGEIPSGLQIDHLCRNKWCVNPDHLEPVTCRENALRGVAPGVKLHLAGLCIRGHSDFTYIHLANGRIKRRCRICARERYQANRADPEWRERATAYHRAWRKRRREQVA